MNKAVLTSFIILCLLCSTFLVWVFSTVQKVRGIDQIFIRSDGSVDPSNAPISRVNDAVYNFTDNLYHSIVVERSHILVDGGGFTLQGYGGGIGLRLADRVNVSICNLKIEQFEWGIEVDGCCNCSISDTIIKENAIGIELYYSFNSSISGNNIKNNYRDGIVLYYSSKNNISVNEIANNEHGIRLHESTSNNVSANNITNNGHSFRLYVSSDNSISGNNIKNSNLGIWLNGSSNNNIIYHNNFINNTSHILSERSSSSPWDNGLEGNYWDNYTDKDENKDGVGDIPFELAVNNTDKYPLMGMFSSYNTSLGYRVNVISNSTIEYFEYLESNSTIKMHVSCVEDYGFCRVTVPHALMDVGNMSVIIDCGLTPVLYANYTLYSNNTHRWIYFSYPHSIHEVDIVPEFPLVFILPLFMIATLLAVIIYRRKHAKISETL